MQNLSKAFLEINDKDVNILYSNDVKAFNFQQLFIGDSLCEYKINTICSSFLRYPYDLISPHSETYILREKIEYYKSLIFTVDAVSINALASTWSLRNRYYSLKQAQIEGISTPYSILLSNANGTKLLKNDNNVIKSIGNCFITDNINSINNDIKSFSEIAQEQDGDEAAIFSATLFNKSNIQKYIEVFGTTFIQSEVINKKEYRCYIIGEIPFIYVRKDINSFDKSAASYKKDSYILQQQTFEGMKNLMKKFDLGYICFDMITSKDNNEIVIDINPYGSMPVFEDFPEPSIALAKLLIEKAKFNKLSYEK
jgi:hypothetical protein